MSRVLLYNSRVNKQSSKLPAVPGLGQSPVSVSPRKQLPLSDTVAGPSVEVTTYSRTEHNEHRNIPLGDYVNVGRNTS